MTTVTTRWRVWRVAHTPPAVSASFISVPPWTLPRGLASSGSITWASVSSSALARWIKDHTTISGFGGRCRGGACTVAELIMQDLNRTRQHRIGATGQVRGTGLDHFVGHHADLVERPAIGRQDLEHGHL